MKPVHICGGGLAGLSLGIFLRTENIPVTITEASHYPRHRVCGEFISGSGQKILHELGLGQLISRTAVNRSIAWRDRDRPLFDSSLPQPAIGISRFALDRELADRFRALGGELITGKFVRESPESEGSVFACGRGVSTKNWIGLKLHCHGLEQRHDLTMHLGTEGYIGVSKIENDRWNVCGLFRLRRNLSPGKPEILPAYLRANGLHALADSIQSAKIDPSSITATTQLRFGISEWPRQTVCIGDFATSIPPFAGNGMSMAFESAQLAFPALFRWARGDETWLNTRHKLQQTLRKQFHLRIRTAQLLHPLLLWPKLRPAVSVLASRNLLPFQLLFRLLR